MAAEFPLPSVNASNPRPLYFEMMPEVFVVGKTIYDDQGADYRVQNGGAGVKQWRLIYDGLTLAEAAILDNHVATTFYSEDEGSGIGFNLRDRDTGILYANVHYAAGGYVKSHDKLWSQRREIILEKRP